MIYQSTHRIIKSWRVAEQRKMTADILRAAAHASRLPPGTVLAMGHTPSTFYYGMWMHYVTRTGIVHDLSHGETAGYLSPYLRLADGTPYEDADLMLTIDPPGMPRPHASCDETSLGRVHIGTCI